MWVQHLYGDTKELRNTEYPNQRHTNIHTQLTMVFDCHDIIINCGQKVAHIENDGLGTYR